MEFLYVLERLRTPALDEVMLAVTRLGEETAFLVAALVVFWCVDKNRGYYLMSVGFIGTMLNQVLKLMCAVPRPWILDPEFTIVEEAREAASGYSFPSGHSQSAVGTFGAIAASAKQKWLRLVCIAIAVLVPLSRMYLGVHTPADVLVGSGMALALVLLLRPIASGKKQRAMGHTILLMLLLSAAFLLFVECYPFPADVDGQNLQSGMKNAYTMIGCVCAVALVYGAEKKYVRFETEAVWWAQILKTVLGLAVVLLVKEGLRAPLEAVLPVYPARAVRYFLIVVAAGFLWPMTFQLFSGLGAKK